MEYTVVEMPERTIIGPAIRTSNNDPEVGAKIGGLWQQFMTEETAAAVPSPVLEPFSCFGMYYNYDFSDMSYDTQVGCESTADAAPEGMELVVIPAGKYAKFAVEGDVVGAVMEAWNAIWAMEELAAQRANTVDFEAYLPGEDMQNAQIEIYIALK